ncbi:MAG: hypothetical protein JWO56_229, partial [Acidobacteria bacterium]|nr:hypothetical protein [Acidobacteriota bacterium]
MAGNVDDRLVAGVLEECGDGRIATDEDLRTRLIELRDLRDLALRLRQGRQSLRERQSPIETGVADEEDGGLHDRRQAGILPQRETIERGARSYGNRRLFDQIPACDRIAHRGKRKSVHRVVGNDDQPQGLAGFVPFPDERQRLPDQGIVGCIQAGLEGCFVWTARRALQAVAPLGDVLAADTFPAARQRRHQLESVARHDPHAGPIGEDAVLDDECAGLQRCLDRGNVGHIELSERLRAAVPLQSQIQRLRAARPLGVNEGLARVTLLDELLDQLPVGILKARKVSAPELLTLTQRTMLEGIRVLAMQLVECRDQVALDLPSPACELVCPGALHEQCGTKASIRDVAGDIDCVAEGGDRLPGLSMKEGGLGLHFLNPSIQRAPGAHIDRGLLADLPGFFEIPARIVVIAGLQFDQGATPQRHGQVHAGIFRGGDPDRPPE